MTANNLAPRGSSIVVGSGSYVDPLDIKVSDIKTKDLGDALAKLCRFNGHGRFFWSVAQHSLLVAYIVELLAPKAIERSHDRADAVRYAILHDAAEAYLGDVAAPLKRTPAFQAYRDAEEKVLHTVFKAYGLLPNPDPVIAGVVKEADVIAVSVEASQLLPTKSLEDWVAPKVDTLLVVDIVERFMELAEYEIHQASTSWQHYAGVPTFDLLRGTRELEDV